MINELFGSARFDLSVRWSSPSLTLNLVIYATCKFVFTCLAVGCPISCGVFTPVFLIGAAVGRCYGEVLNHLTPESMQAPAHHAAASPRCSRAHSATGPTFHVAPQITAGGYAVVGAAAMAAGVTRTVSTAVIVFELTGQLNHMLPVLVAVLFACAVRDRPRDRPRSPARLAEIGREIGARGAAESRPRGRWATRSTRRSTTR